jgi:CheY-like chemotaxis protein
MAGQSILMVGQTPELLKSLALVLRSAGYAVVTSDDSEQALHLALSDSIDLVLLCHSLEKSEVTFLVNSLAAKRRLLPVVYVSVSEFDFPPLGCLLAASAPSHLLRQVEILLHRQRKPSAPNPKPRKGQHEHLEDPTPTSH